jgi:hypothetical protein
MRGPPLLNHIEARELSKVIGFLVKHRNVDLFWA